MSVDLLASFLLRFGTLIFLVTSLFIKTDLVLRAIFWSCLIFFIGLFLLATYWAREYYSDLKVWIGFFVSAFHTFFLFLAGTLGLGIGIFLQKFFPFIMILFRNIFTF